jgi:molybdopterin-guanine dinucleotide biosynthesis protein A
VSSTADAGAAGVVGVVLCGGASRRMGADKATLGPPGRPLAAVVAAALRGAGTVEVLLVGGRGPDLAAVGDAWVPDDLPGQGPLAALATAARRRPGRDLLVCACDLPSIDAAALAPFLRELAAGTPVSVAVLDGVPAWSVVAVSATAASALSGPDGPVAAGERALHRGLGAVAPVRHLTGPEAAALRDADTPDALPPDLRP